MQNSGQLSKYFRSIVTIIFAGSLAFSGCSKKEVEPATGNEPHRAGPPPRSWDIGDQTIKNRLPDDVSDGYLQFSRASDMSYGMTLAHDRISSRSHARSDMLIYVHAGVARFNIGEKAFTASTGDLVFIPRNTVYSADALSNRQLQFVTMYAPPLDSNDVVFHEAAEKVRTSVPKLETGKLDTTIRIDPEAIEQEFENMSDYTDVEEEK